MKILELFNGLKTEYLIRQLFFGAVIFSLFLYLTIEFKHFSYLVLILSVVNTLLYPFSRFTYETIVNYMFGNNFFVTNAIIFMFAKLFTMILCWLYAIIITPLGLIMIYFHRYKEDPKRLRNTLVSLIVYIFAIYLITVITDRAKDTQQSTKQEEKEVLTPSSYDITESKEKEATKIVKLKDKAYYQAHIDEAIAKIEECEASMKFAIETKDESRYKEITKDKECDIAHKVRVAHKQEQRRIEQEAKEKAKQKLFDEEYKKYLQEFKGLEYTQLLAKNGECGDVNDFSYRETGKCKAYSEILQVADLKKQEAKEKEKQKKFDAEYKKYFTQFQSLDYADLQAYKRECDRNFDFNVLTPKCAAYKKLKETKKSEALQKITKKYTKQSLLEYKNKICKGASYGDPQCSLARDLYEKEQKAEIANYHSHEDLLKKDFNECLLEFNKLGKSGKYNKASAFVKTHKCSTVAKAASKLKVYGWFKPIK